MKKLLAAMFLSVLLWTGIIVWTALIIKAIQWVAGRF